METLNELSDKKPASSIQHPASSIQHLVSSIKPPAMCEHLIALDKELRSKGIKELSRGQAWSENCREWVYYDCVFDFDKVRTRYNFPAFVVTHFNNDERSGLEAGFVCDQCNDGVIGAHPKVAQGKQLIA